MSNHVRRVCAGILVTGALAIPSNSSAADERHLLFFGTDLTVDSRFVYTGSITAPFGELESQGLRIRVYGGAGQYRTDQGEWIDKQAGHALVGWASWHGDLGVTVYAGAAAEYHEPRPFQTKSGTEFGAAVLADAWWKIDDKTMLSASAGYADVYETVSGRMAVTRSLNDRFDAVAELRVTNDIDGTHWAVGIGGTLRYRGIDATLVAGASGDEDDAGFSLRAEMKLRR